MRELQYSKNRHGSLGSLSGSKLIRLASGSAARVIAYKLSFQFFDILKLTKKKNTHHIVSSIFKNSSCRKRPINSKRFNGHSEKTQRNWVINGRLLTSCVCVYLQF